ENLLNLTNWTIDRFYPHLQGPDRILLWFREVVERTAFLITDWLRVGFVHGVMNTDNMSVLGLTIDYGPFSFLDHYDPDFTPNTTDLPGRRYAFGQQAAIAYWNLGCLASAIAPLFPDTKELVAELEKYGDIFLQKYYAMMAAKLGLDAFKPEDANLIASFEETLTELKPDMTIFYQLLIGLPAELENEQAAAAYFEESLYQELNQTERQKLFGLLQKYQARIRENGISEGDKTDRMQKANPRFILRNYLLHQAIEKLEAGDQTLFLELQEALKEPYSHKADAFFKKRPDWADRKAGCSMLSCSS
ncbi:MAG TPA: protein adenylyltransferase SelO family protein, partial [Adhaeribacter sp.]|nr:protein adenylyltransferase SelO family protein [Adhaeribacter sp.]